MSQKLVLKATAFNKPAFLTASMTKETVVKISTCSQYRSRFSTILVPKNESQAINPGDTMSFSLTTDQINVNRARKINWTNCFFHYRGAEDNDPTSRLQSFQPFCDVTKSSTGRISKSDIYNLKWNNSLKETIKRALKEHDETKKLPSWLREFAKPVAIGVVRKGYKRYQQFNDGDSAGDETSSDDDEEGSNESDIDLNDSDKKETGDQEITDGGLGSDRSEDNCPTAESIEIDGAELAEKAREVWDFVSQIVF